MASSDEGYGTICKPEAGLACDYYLSPRSEQPTSNQDMDLGLFTGKRVLGDFVTSFAINFPRRSPRI